MEYLRVCLYDVFLHHLVHHVRNVMYCIILYFPCCRHYWRKFRLMWNYSTYIWLQMVEYGVEFFSWIRHCFIKTFFLCMYSLCCMYSATNYFLMINSCPPKVIMIMFYLRAMPLEVFLDAFSETCTIIMIPCQYKPTLLCLLTKVFPEILISWDWQLCLK